MLDKTEEECGTFMEDYFGGCEPEDRAIIAKAFIKPEDDTKNKIGIFSNLDTL